MFYSTWPSRHHAIFTSSTSNKNRIFFLPFWLLEKICSDVNFCRIILSSSESSCTIVVNFSHSKNLAILAMQNSSRLIIVSWWVSRCSFFYGLHEELKHGSERSISLFNFYFYGHMNSVWCGVLAWLADWKLAHVLCHDIHSQPVGWSSDRARREEWEKPILKSSFFHPKTLLSTF